MNRLRNKNLRLLVLTLGLLTVSLACATAERMVAAPVDPPIDCNDDSCLDACLAHVSQMLESAPAAEVGGDYAGADANFNLVTYKVDSDQILEPDTLWVPSEYKAYQQDNAAHQRAWDYFTSLIPADQRKWVTQYVVFTDGSANTLAWVDEVEYGDNAHWKLGVDIIDAANPIYLTATLAHEVGHLITLNADQIFRKENFAYTPYQNTAVCAQFTSGEGCSTPDSYINQFYKKFWVGIYDEWLESVYKADANSTDEFRAIVRDFYSKHADEFQMEYAATNIKEDMAVSFESFLLSPKPTGNSIPDQKILFYYGFPELVAMRSQVIHAICAYGK